MTLISSIVEGDGEVVALPVLLRRFCEWRPSEIYPQILPPIRVRRDRFLNKAEEFHRHLMLASSKCGQQGWILILLDADDDCPAKKGKEILERARNILPNSRISLVMPNKEFEAWYIASATSLHGVRGLRIYRNDMPEDPENIRNSKGWLSERMLGSSYREVADQPAFSAHMDLSQAFQASRSFRKLCAEWDKNIVRVQEA